MGIYKKKKIIRAYSRFPRLRIRDLMFGDIINWTPGRTAWRPAANWMESAAQRGIIAFQRWKYPNSPRIYSTHSIIHLMEGVCWNVTAPRADYLKLQEGKLNQNKVYIVCRYRDFRVKTAADRKIIPEKAQKREEPLPEQLLNNRLKAKYCPGLVGCLSYPPLWLAEVIVISYSGFRSPCIWHKSNIRNLIWRVLLLSSDL